MLALQANAYKCILKFWWGRNIRVPLSSLKASVYETSPRLKNAKQVYGD